jgi:hypothetical protein
LSVSLFTAYSKYTCCLLGIMIVVYIFYNYKK